MFTKLLTTDEQLQECVDRGQEVVIWLFGKCEGTLKITEFTSEYVKAEGSAWYVRRQCKIYL